MVSLGVGPSHYFTNAVQQLRPMAGPVEVLGRERWLRQQGRDVGEDLAMPHEFVVGVQQPQQVVQRLLVHATCPGMAAKCLIAWT
jgi:hypothetical protein